MTYQRSQGDLFGRLGTGIGQGLSEQIPKEIERYRLAQGLEELGKQKDLNPFQQFSKLAATPGVTPQMLQSGSELLRQQAYLDAIKNQYGGQGGLNAGQGGYRPTPEELNKQVKGEIPTLATPEDTAQSYKSYIPPTEQEERKDAFENFNANPARYGYDFENALKERKSITERNQKIQEAHKKQEETAVKKETDLKSAFDTEAARLGIIPIQKEKGLPANFDPKLYQKFEEKLLNSILPKSEGGEGLTQEQATKKYSGELLKAHENYRDISSLSTWSPRDFNRRVDAIQKNISSLGLDAQKAMRDKLIEEYGISPTYASHKMYPIQKGEMPTLKKLDIPLRTGRNLLPIPLAIPEITNATYAQLKKEMGKTRSPLSIAYELEQRNQSPNAWLKYLDDHRDDLEVWQANELGKNINLVDLKDIWLRTWE